MTYYYDTYGWLSDTPIPGRETDIVPMEPEGDMRPNFTGYKWILTKYVESPVQQEQPIDRVMLEQKVADLESEINNLKSLLGLPT